MRCKPLIPLLIALPILGGCGRSGPPDGFDEVSSLRELEEILEAEYPDPAVDSLNLLPGRQEIEFGDLPEIIDRGLIRVLVSPSRTNYFIDNGKQRGFEYDIMREYEKVLRTRRKGRFVMVFLPVPFGRLLPELVAGRGDIAAAGLTVTEARLDSVTFSDPYLTGVSEIVVGRRGGDTLDSLADLSGKTVHVVRSSSYEQHLLELSELLKRRGLPPITVSRAPAYLESEDLLELVDRGIVDFTVVDDHIAEIWSRSLERIRPYPDIVIRDGGQLAWAVRSGDDALRQHLSGFARRNRKGSLLGNVVFKRYFQDSKWVSTGELLDERLTYLRSVVQRYAEEYDFDWLLLAAIAYQESRFDEAAHSSHGAVGLFQIKPVIAAAEPIGVKDISTSENNIKAAVRYLDHVRGHYLGDPEIPDAARIDLMLASYNAGPTRIRRLRRQAAAKGYDPNRWFGNVERMAGRETIRYVANVNRYYYAFRLAQHARDVRDAGMARLH